VDESQNMFGTSGIRGAVGETVTCGTALSVGRALGTEGYDRVAVGRDARESGEMLADALAAGLRETGADAVRLGTAATPTVARSPGWVDADAAVSVTASHNPAPDNGLKFWTAEGHAFGPGRQAAVADRVRADDYDLCPAGEGDLGGEVRFGDAEDRHVEALVAGTDPVDDLTVVVDVGNGTGGLTAAALRELGCTVHTLDAIPDGRFPARPSEPTAENCADLSATVAATDADLGVAHDGDADRMLAVAADGTFLPGDVLLAIFATATAGEGDVVSAPINTSLAVRDALAEVGAELAYTRVGDGFVARHALENGAAFGGEMSGAWIWPGDVPCPDGSRAACRLARLVADRGPLADLAAEVPEYPTRRESHRVGDKRDVMQRIGQRLADATGEVDDRDGIRVDTGEGWYLVRASGTQPLVRLTAEARSPERSEELLTIAREHLEAALPREPAPQDGD
jgi:phosphoglucosamine mutase